MNTTEKLKHLASSEGLVEYQSFDERLLELSEDSLFNINQGGMLGTLRREDCIGLRYKDKFIIGLMLHEESKAIHAFILYSKTVGLSDIRRIQRLIMGASLLGRVQTASFSTPKNDKLHRALGLTETSSVTLKEWRF